MNYCMLPCRIEVTFKADDIAQNFSANMIRYTYDFAILVDSWIDHMSQKNLPFILSYPWALLKTVNS